MLAIVLVAAAIAALGFAVRGAPTPALRRAGVAAAILLLAGAALTRAVLIVPPGQAAVEVFLGSVRPEVRGEGLHIANPLSTFERMNVRRQTIDFTSNGGDGPTVLSISADRNTLGVDASFPFQVAPAHAARLYQRVGRNGAIRDTLVLPAARSAVRASVARFGWAEASVERREDLARAMVEAVKAAVADNLARFGFEPAEARAAIAFAPVLLREVKPDAKVLNAISEKVAAEEDLKRQRVLTDIAKQEAERRANEGLGVARLFAELPTGFSPDQIRSVLAALADKQRADALMKAVETGRVNVMVLPSSTPVALPAMQ